ncbi:MAG TPA: hypothetical protein VL175_04425 [Pirellulales bacterium]|nr:hypothetical protein [Pirellulales bacterium]
MNCPATETDLSAEEAHAIVEPYFIAVREQFLEAGLDRLQRLHLRPSWDMHDSPRHFAGCRDDGSEILVAPELAELSVETVCAILAHECGHAADFCYPGEFILRGSRLERYGDDERESKHWRHILRGWKQRDDDAVELTADAIAETVLGIAIGYRGPCLLQSFSGPRRPLGLR